MRVDGKPWQYVSVVTSVCGANHRTHTVVVARLLKQRTESPRKRLVVCWKSKRVGERANAVTSVVFYSHLGVADLFFQGARIQPVKIGMIYAMRTNSHAVLVNLPNLIPRHERLRPQAAPLFADQS